MRKLLLVAVALFGLVGMSSIASADPPDLNRAFFFGDCEPYEQNGAVTAAGLTDACRGFGIFFGHFDQESLAGAVLDEYHDEFGYNPAYVVKLYAFKVGGGGTHFVPPIVGETYGSCGYTGTALETQGIEGSDITGGLWIAWFEIEVCEPVTECLVTDETEGASACVKPS